MLARSSADATGNWFCCDSTTRRYIGNWSAKGISKGTYWLFINLGDGATHTVDLGLK